MLRIQPERVTEIQQALRQAGYLQREPNGAWDDATRKAMRRYQTENGFASTGLPDAKSLMKLGLGPHPLPEDVDPKYALRKPDLPADVGNEGGLSLTTEPDTRTTPQP